MTKVDRIACPWLIKKFIDNNAEFLFVPAHKVIEHMKQEKERAIPFDIPNVELGHHGEECSFDAIIKKYELDKREPTLPELAKIVRGADTNNRQLNPYSEGLAAIAAGFLYLNPDKFHESFGHDVDPAEADILATVQKPINQSFSTEKFGPSAWKQLPITDMVPGLWERLPCPTDIQRLYAERENATILSLNSSHASLVSHPVEVAELILNATKWGKG